MVLGDGGYDDMVLSSADYDHSPPSLSGRPPALYHRWLGIGLVCLAPAIGSFLYGYDMVATVAMLHSMQLQQDSQDDDSWWHNNFWGWQHAGVLAAGPMGAIASSSCLFVMMRSNYVIVVSRRTELRIAALLYTIGACWCVAAGTVWRRDGLVALLLGRCCVGLGMGCVLHAGPVYVAEMVPMELRGVLVAVSRETSILGGTVVGQWVASSSSRAEWPRLYSWPLVTLVLPFLLLTYVILPRSFRWLALLSSQSTTTSVVAEIQQSQQFIVHDHEIAAVSFDLLQQKADPESSSLRPRNVTPSRRVVAAMSLVVAQAIGRHALLIDQPPTAHPATLFLFFCVSILACLTTDRWGRRRLLVTSCGMVLFAAAAGMHSIGQEDAPEPAAATTIRYVFVWVGKIGYYTGLGPISWCTIVEVFPTQRRGPATALAIAASFVLQLLLPWIPDESTLVLLLVLACGGIYHTVPETAGLSLEEIEETFVVAGGDSSSDDSVSCRSDDTVATTELSPLVHTITSSRTRYVEA